MPNTNIVREIEINGIVSIPVTEDYDSFYDKFIKFIEGNNWTFGGMTDDVTNT